MLPRQTAQPLDDNATVLLPVNLPPIVASARHRRRRADDLLWYVTKATGTDPAGQMATAAWEASGRAPTPRAVALTLSDMLQARIPGGRVVGFGGGLGTLPGASRTVLGEVEWNSAGTRGSIAVSLNWPRAGSAAPYEIADRVCVPLPDEQ
jgi:hypothetical protein